MITSQAASADIVVYLGTHREVCIVQKVALMAYHLASMCLSCWSYASSPMTMCHLCSQAQLAVEGLGARLPAQELLQNGHLIAAATPLKNGVAVPSTLLAVHRVLLEHGVEHVGAVNLRRQVTVVTGIVTTHEVTKRSLTITPVTTTC